MSGPFGSSQWMYNAGSDYEIDNSLRFDDDDTTKLTFTPGSAGTSIQSITVSVWVKRAKLAASNSIISAGGRFDTAVVFDSNDKIQVFTNYAENYRGITSSGVFRDCSAWYHIVAVWDTTNGTSTERHRLYVNGVRQTVSAETEMPQNGGTQLMAATEHTIGTGGRYPDNHRFDGYMAEMHVLDGQTLLPTAFAESGDFGEWKPIDCKDDLTYGDNGFYLDFKSSAVGTASSTTIGADRSGNDNHYTSSNVAVTDQMIDTPTNNFCTVNPIDVQTLDKLKEGNLQLEPAVGRARGTMGVTTGKWYFEVLMLNQTSSTVDIGISGVVHKISADDGDEFVRIGHPTNGADKVALNNGGTTTDNLGTVANGDIIGVFFDMDAEEVSFLVNNSAIAAAATGVDFSGLSNNGTMTPHIINNNGRRSVANFGQDSSFAGNKTAGNNADGGGQGDFFYAPPSGYLALCTKNLTACAVTPSEHFSVLLNAGDSSADEAFTTGFQTDWVWSFIRNVDASHEMVDSVRGVTKVLMSDSDANETTDAESLQVFNSDGFTLGTNSGGWNRDSRTYVYYSWKGGTAFSNDASATSVGSIDSAGKVNAVAGFSIIGYTGNGTNGATVAHGLSKKPEMIWVKNRSKSNGESWCVYVSAGGLDATDQLQLNTNATFSDTADAWNDTEPTTSVFSISGDDRTNDDGETFIAYCFHSVDGYCKVGSYVGNAADDAPFVYTGFRPKWVMYKKVAGSASWFIVDTARNTVNKAFLNLSSDTATDENTSGAGQTELFILSNGFKPGGAGGDANGNNEPYIYLAFAETPFKNSNAR